MRFGLLSVVFFLSVTVAFSQTWRSDVQVFRDVYGHVDAGGSSVRWDASKESKPSPYIGHSFATTGQEMVVEVILRAEVEGHLYVATSAVPKVAPDEYQCHSCMAASGAAVYSQKDGEWKLDAASPAVIYGGGWGKPPVVELRYCGPETYCFVVEDWSSGQGYSESTLKVFGPVGNTVRSLLSVPFESDDDGAYDPKAVDGPSTWKRMSGGVEFVGDLNRRSPFFDLELIGVTRSCSRGRCASSWRHQVYQYSGGQFSAIKLPTAP